jgi:hypothetical protein
MLVTGTGDKGEGVGKMLVKGNKISDGRIKFKRSPLQYGDYS